MWSFTAVSVALLLPTTVQLAHAEVVVAIDKSAQRMLVFVDGSERYV